MDGLEPKNWARDRLCEAIVLPTDVVDRPAIVGPFAFNLHVGSVHALRFSRWFVAGLRLCRQEWCKLNHSTAQRSMINVNAAFFHDLLGIAEGTKERR